MRAIAKLVGIFLPLALVAAGTAAPVGAQATRFGAEETVVAVEIPVQVLVDGQPVQGLDRSNFEVFEGRRAQPIVDFEVVDLSLAQTERGRLVALAPDVSPAGRRHFLLLFDLGNSDPSAMLRAREAASAMVLDALHPSDLVAVATWSYSQGPKLLLGFTPDRRQVDAAIASLGLVDMRNRMPDPLALVFSEAGLRSTSVTPPATGPAGDRFQNFAAIDLENLRDFAANERASAQQVKGSEIAAFTNAFTAMAQLMANVRGRKHVVLFSQGFDSEMLTGTADQAVTDQAGQSVIFGEIWNVDTQQLYGDTKLVNQLERMLVAFRRADCSIQAVDIGTLEVGADVGTIRRRSGRDTMLTMARDTGGQLFENFNDLGEAMGKMLESTSITYVLTIQPRNLKLDGKYHELRVRLKDGPSRARLVHRPGYYAPKPFAQTAALERQVTTAQLLVSGQPGGDLAAGVVAAPFRGPGGRMHVPLVIEVEGASLAGARSGNAIPCSVYAYVFDETGTVVDFVAQSLALDYTQIGQRLRRESLKFVGDLILDPGRYTLRTLVRAGDEGFYWLGHTTLEVPDATSGELAIGPPLRLEPMTTGVVVRSSTSAAKTQGLAFPFAVEQEFFLPDALPAVARGGEMRTFLSAFGLAPGDLEVSGFLVAADGQPVAGSEARLVRRFLAADGSPRLEVAVRAGSAAPGDYTLRVEVLQEGKRAASSAALRVQG
jgi:VWFA-related protein